MFLAPGLLYEWAVEVRAGYRRPESANKTLHAFTRSVVAQVFLSPIAYSAWRYYRDIDIARSPAGDLLFLGVALVAYVALPVLAGVVVGTRQRGSRTGTPSAWDALFDQPDLRGYVRARLRTGAWVGGVYLRESGGVGSAYGFASGYPDPETLYLPAQLVVDPQTGEMAVGPDGPLLREWGLLLQGRDIEILEFQPLQHRERSQYV